MVRDSAPRNAVERRLDSQLSNEVRTSRADIVVTNDSSVAAMLNQIDSAFDKSTGASGTG
jgi:dephospho-CoA kinase